MNYSVTAAGFSLRLDCKTVDPAAEDGAVLHVVLQTASCAVEAAMAVDGYAAESFFAAVESLRGTLRGTASVREPYGKGMHLAFEGDGRGHVTVSGRLCTEDEAGNTASVEFCHRVDQTCLNR